MLKKSLSLVLMTALVLSMLSGISSPSYAVSGNWLDGISLTTTTWDSGGTIGSASELAQFCYNVNHGKSYAGQTITLTSDIDLNEHYWTPIGTTTYKFSGTFNGQGHAVSNMSITSNYGMNGLFGNIAAPHFKSFRQRQHTVGGNGTAGYRGACRRVSKHHSNIATAAWESTRSPGPSAVLSAMRGSECSVSKNCCNTGDITSTNNGIAALRSY